MDELLFISSIIASLAWPLTIVLIIFILKNPISKLILSIERITGNNWAIDFSNKIALLEQHTDEIIAVPREKQFLDEKVVGHDIRIEGPLGKYMIKQHSKRYYDLLAVDDTRDAIVSSWIMVEAAMRDLVERKQVDVRGNAPIKQVLKELEKNQIISNNIVDLVNESRRLRNEALHNPKFKIPVSDAKNYIAIVEKISSHLQSIDQINIDSS